MPFQKSRRRMSFVTFLRTLSGRRRAPLALAEQSERLATDAELMALRVGL